MNSVSLTLSIISLVVATASVAAALGLWRSAHRANQIAMTASASAAQVADLDAARRHEEIQPVFEIEFVPDQQHERADLRVSLVSGMEELDEVTFRILNETGTDHWGHGLPPNLSQEDADIFVWGPWEFNGLAAVQISDRRTSRTRPYSRRDGDNWDRLPLLRTRPGPWMHEQAYESWERERRGPIRLSAVCTAAGYPAWTRLYEIDTSAPATVDPLANQPDIKDQ